MAKSRKKEIRDEWLAQQPERERVTRKLEERIAYHTAKLEEEQLARKRVALRGWRFWRFRRAS